MRKEVAVYLAINSCLAKTIIVRVGGEILGHCPLAGMNYMDIITFICKFTGPTWFNVACK